jgi:hypothetical protein
MSAFKDEFTITPSQAAAASHELAEMVVHGCFTEEQEALILPVIEALRNADRIIIEDDDSSPKMLAGLRSLYQPPR